MIADEAVVRTVFLSAGADPEKLAHWMSQNIPQHAAGPSAKPDADAFPTKGTPVRASR